MGDSTITNLPAQSSTPAETDLVVADIGTPPTTKKMTLSVLGGFFTRVSALIASTGSALVGFIHSGVGALTRTVQARLRDTVHADDYTTLQQALNTGKLVRLTDGATYALTSQITIPAGGGLIGKGILTFSSTNFTATTRVLDATSVVIYALSVNDIVLRDFKMVGTTTADSYLFPIAIRGVTKADVWGLEITGLNAGTCAVIDSSFDVSVSNNKFHTCQIDRTGSTAQLTAVEIDDNRISAVGSERIQITHNRIKNLTVTAGFLAAHGYQTDGITLKIGSTNCLVAHNVMDTMGEGIDTYGDDNEFIGNVIRSAYGFGIKLVHGASRNLVSANRIYNPGLAGITLGGSSTAAQNTDRNIVIGNLVSGVNAAGDWTADTTYAYGVANDGTFVCTNNVFQDNRCVSSSGADYHINFASAGTGNVAYSNSSDGTPAAEANISAGTVYLPNRVGDTTGVAYTSGAAPRYKLEETDAASNEKLWDIALVAGDWFRRTRTDVDGTGADFEKVTRTGTTVDLIQWFATAMRRGGAVSATRYEEVDSSGRQTIRYDDNGVPVAETFINYGVTASGNGIDIVYSFGTGGSAGGTAYQCRVLATDTWAAAGNRSARIVWDVMLAGTLTRVMDMDPSAGLAVGTAGTVVVSNAGHLKLRSYSVASLPTAANTREMIYVNDETGGAIPAFSDGTNWRRVTDRAIVS